MKIKFLISTVLTTAVALGALMTPEEVRADDCLLDRDDDGIVDIGTDDDGGANSSNDDTALACGVGASVSGQFSTAIGSDAVASGNTQSTALGAFAEATQTGAVAVGSFSDATGAFAVAVGDQSVASADGSIAVGAGSEAEGTDSVAIGSGAAVTNIAASSVALGAGSVASQPGVISVGRPGTTRRITNVGTGLSNTDAVNVAQLNRGLTDFRFSNNLQFFSVNGGSGNAVANGAAAITIGPDALTSGDGAIAFGQASRSSGSGSVAIGSEASATSTVSPGLGGVAIGDQASAINGSTSVGSGSSAAQDAVAFGRLAIATAQGSSALGGGASASANNAIALGVNTQSLADGAISVGDTATASGEASFALGKKTTATGISAIAIGGDGPVDADDEGSEATADYATAIGPDAKATGQLSYALGAISSASGVNSTAFGSFANAAGLSSLALGSGADALADFSSAIGTGSTASHAASFALGAGAATTRINQIVLGQDGSGFGATAPVTVTIPGLPTADSNAAQSGTLFYVTVDANGNLGFTGTAPTSSAPSGGTPAVASGGQSTQAVASTRAPAPAVASAPATAPSAPIIAQQSVDGGPAGMPGEGVMTADASRALGIDAPATMAQAPAQTQSPQGGVEDLRATNERPAEVAMLDANQDIPEPPSNANADAGTQRVATAAYSPAVQLSPAAVPTVSQVTQTQFDQLSTRVDALDGRVSLVEGQLAIMNEEIASSTAVAVAMGGTTFLPDQNFSLSANIGTYDGAHAGSFSIGALVSENVAVNAGVATGFNRNGKTAGRVGVTIGF